MLHLRVLGPGRGVTGSGFLCGAPDLVLTDIQLKSSSGIQLIRELQKVGVEVLVCGQALNYKGLPDDEVADGIPIAAARA